MPGAPGGMPGMGGPGGMPGGGEVIRLTEEENAAVRALVTPPLQRGLLRRDAICVFQVERLAALGFPKEMAAQAFAIFFLDL